MSDVSDVSASPGADAELPRKGRPRSEQTDRAILAATRASLVELGWGGLTMGHVAARAGVAKTTLYRRWPSKNELVVDAVTDVFEDLELADLGSLRADLEGVIAHVAEIVARPETQASLYALFAEGARDPLMRRRIRDTFIEPLKRLVREGRGRAQARGEIPPDADPAAAEAEVDLIYDVIAGTLEHRMLVSGEPVTEGWIRRFVALLLDPLGGPSAGPDPRQNPAGSV